MSPPADSHGTSPASHQSKSGPTSSFGPATKPSSDVDADDTTLPMALSWLCGSVALWLCGSVALRLSRFRSAASAPGAKVVGHDVLAEPRDVGREDAPTGSPGHRVDEPRQTRVVAEHEDVELRPRAPQLVNLRDRRADGLLRRRPVERRPSVHL